MLWLQHFSPHLSMTAYFATPSTNLPESVPGVVGLPLTLGFPQAIAQRRDERLPSPSAGCSERPIACLGARARIQFPSAHRLP
jgi:hypothetical protein